MIISVKKETLYKLITEQKEEKQCRCLNKKEQNN